MITDGGYLVEKVGYAFDVRLPKVELDGQIKFGLGRSKSRETVLQIRFTLPFISTCFANGLLPMVVGLRT